MIWGWWSGHQEGPGGGLLLQGHGAGLAGENVREPLRKWGLSFLQSFASLPNRLKLAMLSREQRDVYL